MRRLLPRLAALLLVDGCATPRAAETAVPVRIDGSTGVMPLAVALADAYRAEHPGARVVLGEGLGASARLDAVAEGRIDVALASHGLEPEALARRGLTAHEVARVAVVFATPAAVPVRGVTQRQLCDVYEGRVTDWRTLGGPALAIAPRTRPVGEVDADVVLEGVPCLRTATLGAHVQSIERPEAMAAALTETPGAIGMTSLPFVERSAGRLRALALDGVAPGPVEVRSGAYPLTRRSVFVTRADPPSEVRAFLAFVRGPVGARVIAASGAVDVER